jgi:importin subunit alpha-1
VHIRYLASQGVIPRFCALFNCPDSKIVMVAMEGIENILRVGKADALMAQDEPNPYPDIVEQCSGLDLLEALQHHASVEICSKAQGILRVSRRAMAPANERRDERFIRV